MNVYRVFFRDNKKQRSIDLNYACNKPIEIIEALNKAALSDWVGIVQTRHDVTEDEIRKMKSPVMILKSVFTPSAEQIIAISPSLSPIDSMLRKLKPQLYQCPGKNCIFDKCMFLKPHTKERHGYSPLMNISFCDKACIAGNTCLPVEE